MGMAVVGENGEDKAWVEPARGPTSALVISTSSSKVLDIGGYSVDRSGTTRALNIAQFFSLRFGVCVARALL